MTTINDLSVASSVSSDDKLPLWQNANGVTRALPISVLDGRYVTQDNIAQLAADAKVETFVSSILPNPGGLPTFVAGTTFSLTLANQYYSADNIEVFFDGTFQGPDQYTLIGFGLTFISPIPLGVQNVYIRGGAARIIGAPSDDTVSTSSIKDGAVTTPKLADDAVTADKLAPQSVGDSSLVIGSKLYNRINDIVSVKDPAFGARGDGVTDDTASINAALTWLAQNGGTLNFPAGKYLVSGAGLLLDQSAVFDNSIKHGRLLGSGQGATEIFYTGTGSALTYKGGQPNAMNAYLSIEQMRFLGVSQSAGTGLTIQHASALTLNKVLVQVFGTGISGTDVLQSTINDTVIGANGGGIVLAFNDFSQPNAINFSGCHIISNLNFGVNLGDPVTCVFLGGSVQGNGVGGGAANRYGVGVFANISSPGLAGAACASFIGTYFEANEGNADIWFTAGNGSDGSTSLLAQGCTFNRLSNASCVANNVRADIGAANKVQLTLIGNGFNGFGSYTPSFGRLYVQVNPSGGSVYDVTDLGNMYGSNTEKPVYIGPNKTGAAMASAYVTFDGTAASPTPIKKYNISAITKNGPGDYTITFEKQGPSINYPVSINVNGACFPVIFSPGAANVRIQTLNPAQALTDFALVSVVCYGNGDVT
jgi:hypothetical protein